MPFDLATVAPRLAKAHRAMANAREIYGLRGELWARWEMNSDGSVTHWHWSNNGELVLKVKDDRSQDVLDLFAPRAREVAR